MISIIGTTHMTFTLPTNIETAFHYYEDLQRILNFLPRIEFVEAFDKTHLRMCYVSRELNAYDIRIYCDVLTETDPENYTIFIKPQETAKNSVKPSASFTSATTYGYYSSQSYFYDEGDQTRLEYHLTLEADLPKPWALKMMPDTIMNSIAGSITNYRIHEIANGFIEQSVSALPVWASQNGRYA